MFYLHFTRISVGSNHRLWHC